jgi:hypothetical protein
LHLYSVYFTTVGDDEHGEHGEHGEQPVLEDWALSIFKPWFTPTHCHGMTPIADMSKFWCDFFIITSEFTLV